MHPYTYIPPQKLNTHNISNVLTPMNDIRIHMYFTRTQPSMNDEYTHIHTLFEYIHLHTHTHTHTHTQTSKQTLTTDSNTHTTSFKFLIEEKVVHLRDKYCC